jgi:hypothetical protein
MPIVLTANAKQMPKNKNSLYIGIYSDSNLYSIADISCLWQNADSDIYFCIYNDIIT